MRTCEINFWYRNSSLTTALLSCAKLWAVWDTNLVHSWKCYINSNEKQVSPLLWDVRGSDDDGGKSLCSASCCGGNVDEELFSETRKK